MRNLDAKLKENGYSGIVDISTLKGASCAGIPVYDFDILSRKISSLLHIGTPKSVNAIYVKNDTNIYFIEMLGIKSVINSIKSDSKYISDQEKIDAIQKKFISAYIQCIDKVYESYSTIIAFWGYTKGPLSDYASHSNFFSFFMDKANLKIGLVLLTDFDSRDELVYSFAYLMNKHKFCSRRFGNMLLYNCKDFKKEIVDTNDFSGNSENFAEVRTFQD